MEHNPLKTLFHKKSKSQARHDPPEDESKSAERHPHVRSPPPRSSQSHAGESLVGSSYSDVSQGAAPEVGTLPIRGNAKSPMPSETSRTSQRKSSVDERPSRPPDGRHGFVGGMARSSSHTSTSRAKTPNKQPANPGTLQTDVARRGSEEPTPVATVPPIPQEYVQSYTEHKRNLSTLSQDPAKLPISEQFSSASYYTQPGGPQKPEWSPTRQHMPGEYPETINTTSSAAPPVNRKTADRLSDPMAPAEYTYHGQDNLTNSPVSPSGHSRSRSDNPRNFSRLQPQEGFAATGASSVQSEEVPSPPPSSHETGYDSSDLRQKASQTSIPHRSAAEIRQASEQKFFNGKPLLVEGSAHPPNLKGIVDLGKTEQSTIERVTAQPVYHDTVKPTVHHVTEERIHRDIHYHHIYHRVLPIIDVQVLPTKHYVPGPDGTLFEIPAPPHYREHDSAHHPSHRTGDSNRQDDHFVIAETVSKIPNGTPLSEGLPSKSNQRSGHQPRAFTARNFEGTEGETKHYVTKDGIPRTETTWIHPPRLATDLQEQGKTKPVIFNHDEKNRIASSYAGESTPGVDDQTQRQDGTRGRPAVALHEKLAEEAVRLAAERKQNAGSSKTTSDGSPAPA